MTDGNLLSRFLPSGYKNKQILILISVVIGSVIVDTSITRIFTLNIAESSIPRENLSIFIIMVALFSITQYVILGFVKQKSSVILSTHQSHIKTMHKIVSLAQYALVANLVFVTLQMLITSYYNTILLTSATTISYGLSITAMALLAKRFFSWFRSNKNIVVLSYGLSSAIVAINAALTLLLVANLLGQKPPVVHEFLFMVNTFIPSGSTIDMLNNAFVISSILSFISMWISTSLLLRHYSAKLGKVKYWIIIAIPLGYFVSQFVSNFVNLFSPFLNLEPVSFGIVLTLTFTFSQASGGILFGIAFWTIARNIPKTGAVRHYMIISAYGLMLFFISNQAIVLTNAPYPPFGLMTISFVGLSSYMVLLGIYSSAISVAEDSKLRQSIRNFAMKESKLLDSIGTAQMEQEIQKRVLTLTKLNQDRLEEESGIEASLTEEDMKEYLAEVLNEVKKISQHRKDHRQQ